MKAPDFAAIRDMLSAEQEAIAHAWDALPLSVRRILMSYAGMVETSSRWQFMRTTERNQLARTVEKAAGQLASLDAFITEYKTKAKALALGMPVDAAKGVAA